MYPRTYSISVVGITGGTINGATIGATTPASGAFTTLSASGDFAVATSKFTVASATGNTVVAGTLGVGGAVDVNYSIKTYATYGVWSVGVLRADSDVLFTGAVTWGGDTNIYRASANVLKTDDAFQAEAITGYGTIVSASATGGLGYGTGAGGAVTQATNRTTGVTLDKVCGAITLVSAAGSTTPASFTVTNSTVAATDTIYVSQKSGTDLYEIHVTAVAAGSFVITCWTTGGTTTEQPVFNFAVLKAVAA